MSKWATLLKYGKQVADSSLKYGKQAANSSAAKTMGDAMIHPQRTLTGLGKATKTAVVGGGMGYLAWENIVNDKPIVRTAADVLVGEETVDKGLEVAGKASDKVGSMAEKVGENMESISSSVSGVSGAWSGIGSFLKNMLGGNGLDMLGNFFGNIGKGNVSGLSMLGLVASSLLIFGRFGWLGKIAGALMGMMLIGSNSRGVQIEQPSQSESQDVQRNGGMRR
ncbi:antitoxin [Parabacteroides sp. BX2]|uniref:Antitoxin n=1 Tax=Parabacteroides segnis TaxID=2763058 RepID=A0ABR7DXJ1_9BACT|nr:antitoxin [Parabacteroides segnis]MBC5641856.1 antitoxin [Parabacteroides segnis]